MFCILRSPISCTIWGRQWQLQLQPQHAVCHPWDEVSLAFVASGALAAVAPAHTTCHRIFTGIFCTMQIANCKLPFVCGQTNVRWGALVDSEQLFKSAAMCWLEWGMVNFVRCMPSSNTLTLPAKFTDRPVHVGCALWLPTPPHHPSFSNSLLAESSSIRRTGSCDVPRGKSKELAKKKIKLRLLICNK